MSGPPPTIRREKRGNVVSDASKAAARINVSMPYSGAIVLTTPMVILEPFSESLTGRNIRVSTPKGTTSIGRSVNALVCFFIA